MEKNMRVLLISANTEKINILPAPLGLNYVAAAAQESDHDVRLLDLMSHADILAPVRQAVESFRPEIIGISVRNIDDQVMQAARFLLDDVRGIVRECRNLSGAPIVLGGAGYSIFPQAVLDYLEADMGIQGEGEAAFPSYWRGWRRERIRQGCPASICRAADCRANGRLSGTSAVCRFPAFIIF